MWLQRPSLLHVFRIALLIQCTSQQLFPRKKISIQNDILIETIDSPSSIREFVLNATIQSWLIALHLLQDDDEELRLV
jgi:hypothetical protein